MKTICKIKNKDDKKNLNFYLRKEPKKCKPTKRVEHFFFQYEECGDFFDDMNVFKNHACACAQAPRAGHQSPLAEEQSTGDVSDLPRDEKSNNYWTRNL